jgi:hypothetical protein
MGPVEIVVMVVAIVGGTLLILAVVFGALFGVSALGIKGLAGARADEARQRYSGARLIVNASFFGQQSLGVTQGRGNGTLIVTDSELVFDRWLPRKEFKVALKSIEAIETPNSFLGKSRFTPLLKVVFRTEGGQPDAMAWQVPDLEEAKRVVESGR